ncbi:Uncharacterised protein [Mycobacterium tuberculosis]|nr:Uncharacterised protein [Mycobacterium tuberculosis]CNU00793.1 Uncharacterised protein [Mycobacterium tuberculosis]CNU53483.1 Uncharacterised protein [Mycobacterium tuberculosis]CNU79119.1 Uncharacterised protein [Mycobacterium tuberculosis]CNV80248.1 Uncharacterised protein [Mycobacterium tuberculosis]
MHVAQRVSAAHKGPLARQRRLRELVERGVEGPDGEPVSGLGIQQPLGVIAELC